MFKIFEGKLKRDNNNNNKFWVEAICGFRINIHSERGFLYSVKESSKF